MAYRGFSGGGFVGNHLTAALLEALRPAADNAGRHATVGDPSSRAAPYVSDGESWKSVPLVSDDDTSLVSADGIIALSEVTDYVNLTATGTAFTGACEYAGYVCTVAAGNITVYDNTSAAGTVIVPTTALVVGAYPIFGAGTNGKMALTTGCHVVLSGAAAVNVLVG